MSMSNNQLPGIKNHRTTFKFISIMLKKVSSFWRIKNYQTNEFISKTEYCSIYNHGKTMS